jgi:prepilin-type N-terminal cleavage/methylation domain-containing protein
MLKLWKSQSGITMIELMITAVIIGIVSAMAVPQFQTAADRIRTTSAQRDVISTLRLARSMAVADKQPYGIHFDEDARIVTLFKDLVNPENFTFESGDSVVRVDTLPTEFNYLATDMDNSTLVFQRSGTAHFVGGGNIWLMADTPHIFAMFTIDVLASTGRVRNEAYYY